MVRPLDSLPGTANAVVTGIANVRPISNNDRPVAINVGPISNNDNMEEDEGKGVKRRNDDSAALLPTQETRESTNNQEELQDDGDVQMQDVAVASPNKVDNDKANMKSIKEIIEKVLAESDSRFLTNWINRGHIRWAFLRGHYLVFPNPRY